MGMDNRRFERLGFGKTFFLELDSGKKFSGQSVDVSMNGMFLSLPVPPLGVAKRDRGMLKWMAGEEEFSFPCLVIRVTEQGIALQLEKNEAAFGLALTRGIFEEMAARKRPNSPANKK